MKLITPLTFLFLFAQSAVGEIWNLPQQLSGSNLKVRFEVDSTWHLVKGEVKNVDGKLWLEDPSNFQSIKGSFRAPISSFDTNSESRDEKMRKVMHEQQHPFVDFVIVSFDGVKCDPKTLSNETPCEAAIEGDLTINAITKNVLLKTFVTKKNDAYEVSATTTIKWNEFEIEDPSILVAKLYEDVNIQIDLLLSSKK